ncbi:MAG: hypothetical protein AAB066_05680, partial [Candidatus Margulisiibacteriota bacterium]
MREFFQQNDGVWTRRYHAVALLDAAAVERAIQYVTNNPFKANLSEDEYTLCPPPTPRSLPWG